MARLSRANFRRNNSGVALVTVLVIVAIVSTIAVDMAMNQHLWLSQAQNLKDRAQADWVDRGAQQYVAIAMDRDKQDSKIDDLNEAWAIALPPFKAEGGEVAIAITDLQGRFNLNSLYQNGKYNAEFGAVFRRLLVGAGINANTQDAILDWIDKDSQARSAGAEDDYYQSLTPGYRAANQPLQSVRELLLIKGFTPDIVGKLQSVATALPRPTAININTAPAEVLAALFNGMSLPEARQIVVYRQKHPFHSVSEFRKAVPATYPMPKETLLTTASEYFLVHSTVQFDQYYKHTLAYLYRPLDSAPSHYYYHDRPLIRIAEDKANG
ncbi:MAG: type II secretion system minor pseudopilin GspK [Acidiferrobacterales bacterium]